MKEPRSIDRLTCLALHQELLARFGGLEGIRDEGMLESALSRAAQRFHYGKPTQHEMAAAYAAEIVKNHPFLDGNKRTGFIVAALSLEINGFTLTASEPEAVIMTRGLAAGEIEEAACAAWLKNNSTPRK